MNLVLAVVIFHSRMLTLYRSIVWPSNWLRMDCFKSETKSAMALCLRYLSYAPGPIQGTGVKMKTCRNVTWLTLNLVQECLQARYLNRGIAE
mmetsp:Transcript_72376/g.137668  ORF Transcript_72376/g.137668 Transcript_72376/m.137668 type:complete len:92 (+) Transcript_72376:1-276(+)